MPSQYAGQVGFPCAVAAFDGILLLADGNGVNAEKPDSMSVVLLLYKEESLLGVHAYGDSYAALRYSASSLWSAVCSLRAALIKNCFYQTDGQKHLKAWICLQ